MSHNAWRRIALLLLAIVPHAIGVGPFCSSARAQEPLPAPVTQNDIESISQHAKALMQARKFAEAYGYLRQRDKEVEVSPEIRFLLAQCAYELGRYAEAISHYRAILGSEPDSPRVRAELGKAYLADKQIEAARIEFEAVLAGSPPPQVRADIDNLLAAAQRPKNWITRLTVGYLYDSNVNVGPNTLTVQLFGIPFELTPSSAPRSDHALRTTLSAAHLGQWSANAAWHSEFALDSTDYRNLNAFDYLQFTALMGPKWRTGQQQIFVPFSAEYAKLGHQKYSEAYSLAPQIEHAVGERFSLKGGASAQHRVFQIQPDRSGTTWAGLIAVKHSGIAPGNTVELSYRHVRDNARADFLSTRSDWLSVALARAWGRFSLYVEPTIGWIRYDEKEAVFDSARKDKRVFLTVNLAFKLWKDTLSVGVGATLVRNRSNISINEYDRSLVAVQLMAAF